MSDAALQRPGARYGGGSGPSGRRQKVVIYTVSIVLAVAATVLVSQRFGGTEEISGTETGFDLIDDAAVRVRFDVTRRDPAQPGYCIVRARSLDGSETGRREFYVPGAAETLSSYEVVVRTSKPPVVGDVYGCGLDVPQNLRP